LKDIGFFWRLYFCMVKYLSFHDFFFCLKIFLKCKWQGPGVTYPLFKLLLAPKWKPQHKISLWVQVTCYLVEKVMKLLSNSQGMCSLDRCCEYGWIFPHRGLDNKIHLTYVSNLDQVARCWMYSLTHKKA
jgi:hypothetical protein